MLLKAVYGPEKKNLNSQHISSQILRPHSNRFQVLASRQHLLQVLLWIFPRSWKRLRGPWHRVVFLSPGKVQCSSSKDLSRTWKKCRGNPKSWVVLVQTMWLRATGDKQTFYIRQIGELILCIHSSFYFNRPEVFAVIALVGLRFSFFLA